MPSRRISTRSARSPASSACSACAPFSFQEGHKPEAERAFRHIAALTNGAHCRFDSNSPDQLRELLGAVAAYAAGGRRALADLSKRSTSAVKLIASQIG